MLTSKALRDDIVWLLNGGRAHVGFKKSVSNVPEALRGKKPPRFPYSSWQQIENMRICQWDILEYIRNSQHVSPEWPSGYWPAAAPPSRNAWSKCIRAFEADLKALEEMATDPSTDLLATIPADPDGPTILHELLLVADHNAYHLGQLVILRRALGAWKD